MGRERTEERLTSADVWEGRMEGNKMVGRSRTKVLDWMIQETDGGTYEDLKKLAMDRKQWRTWNLGPVSEDRTLKKKNFYDTTLV